jgi:VIT1/CCC1 family predicted Fe2+/Mn2+ transporter
MFPFLDDHAKVRCNRHMTVTGNETSPYLAEVTTAPAEPTEAGESHHTHRNVSGGWLRAATFGAMDGLVTNTSLIAGVGGGGATHSFLLVGGLAGLFAGAFSMAAGEWTSVHTQNAMVAKELARERRELVRRPEAERAELAVMLMRHGLSLQTAHAAAGEIAADTDVALRFHAREELGIDSESLPSERTAAAASFLAFAVGALIPLLPLLAGSSALWLTLLVAGIAAVVGGAAVSRLTSEHPVRGALVQLAMVAAATAATYGLGHLIGALVR